MTQQRDEASEYRPDPQTLADYNQITEQARAKARRDRYFGDKPTPVASEAGKVYLKGLNAPPEPVKPLEQSIFEIARQNITSFYGQRHTARRVAPVSLDEAWDLLRLIMNGKLAKWGRTMWFDAAQHAIVDDMLRYFLGDPSSSIPLHKNLYLFGGVGVGKTMLLQACSELCHAIGMREQTFQTRRTQSVIDLITEQKSYDILTQMRYGNWLLEDFGKEKKTIKVWGDEGDPIDSLLTFRHELFVSNDLKTHFDSNVHPDDTEKKYGPRTFDRFKEWIHSIELPGDSKRPDTTHQPHDD